MTNLQNFISIYSLKLAEAVKEKPEDYMWAPNVTVEMVAGRMAKAIENRSFNHDGLAFKKTCKELNIKYTRKAILEYLNA